MSHTKEPWFLTHTPPYLMQGQIHQEKVPITIKSGAHSEEIATVWTCLLPHEANATRIVACVNAMAGIPDPALLMELIERFANFLDTAERIGYLDDDPEGSRYIKVSETLVNNMLRDYQKSRGR